MCSQIEKTVAISETDHAIILPIIQEHAVDEKLTFSSCLDVGSGLRTQDQWFSKFRHSRPPHRFVAAEIDPEIVEELKRRGIATMNPLEDEGVEQFDLTLALEVIEHLTPDKSVAFLDFCARRTGKLLALTTPNFEYWNIKDSVTGARAYEDYRECRWIPDHFAYFDRKSDDPHFHKQAMTPGLLHDYFEKSAFGRDPWRFRIYRAWPWQIRDVARDRAFDLHFKIFAVAWAEEDNVR